MKTAHRNWLFQHVCPHTSVGFVKMELAFSYSFSHCLLRVQFGNQTTGQVGSWEDKSALAGPRRQKQDVNL